MSTPSTQNRTKRDVATPVRRGLVSVASVMAILTFVTAGLGYGVSLAIHSTLHVPNSIAFNSALDLIDLAKYVVPLALMKFQMPLDNTSSMYWVGPALVGSMVLCLAWALAAHLWHKRLKLRVAFGRQAARRRRALAGLPQRDDTAGKVAASYAIPAILPWLGWGLIALVVRAWLAVFVALLWAPLAGYSLGQHYIHDYVVGPERCEVPLDRKAWLAAWNSPKPRDDNENFALCVRITRAGTVAEGRVVTATTSAIVLYDPKTGRTTRPPLDGAQVESVGNI